MFLIENQAKIIYFLHISGQDIFFL